MVKKKKRNSLKPFTFTDAILALILLFLAIIIIFPFYTAFLQSIVPQTVFIRSGLMLIPPVISLESYQFVFSSKIIWISMLNSVLITVIGTLYNMALTTMGAYGWNKPFPGNKIFRFLLVFTMFFSGGLIPYYLLIGGLHLKNTLWVMIIPSGVNLIYMIILADNFESIPKSVAESAKVDGANDFIIFSRIILPMSLPILATLTLYNAVERWNEWYHGMLFVTDVNKFPLQLVLRNVVMSAGFLAQDQRHATAGKQMAEIYTDGVKMATIVVTMIPVLMIYPLLQRYFLKGITLGAVKE